MENNNVANYLLKELTNSSFLQGKMVLENERKLYEELKEINLSPEETERLMEMRVPQQDNDGD